MYNFLASPTAEHMLMMYIILLVASALVQSLPSPVEYGGVWYKALYNFLSAIVLDFKSFIKNPPVGSVTTVPGVGTTISTLTSSAGNISSSTFQLPNTVIAKE